MYLLDRTLRGHCLGTFVEINHKKKHRLHGLSAHCVDWMDLCNTM